MVKQARAEDEPKHAPKDAIVELAEDGAGAGGRADPWADGGVVTIREDEGADSLPAHAEEQEDGSVRLPLKYPRTLRWRGSASGQTREEHYDALVLRRLTGADIRKLAAAKPDDLIPTALALSTGMPRGVMTALFDMLDGVDARAAGDVVAFFTGAGQSRTGR